MLDLGTVKPGTTLYIPFHTFDSNDPSASVTITGLATTDIEVYKDGGTTQRASDSGYALLDTDGIDFDATTGIHGISIDLADNTTANFYEAGSQYWVVIASITVDAATVNFVAATFRIGYPGAVLDTTIATLSSQTSFTLEDGSADDSAYVGCPVYVHDLASAIQVAFGYVSAYTGSTKTVTLAADPGIFTMAAGDNISFFPPAQVGSWNNVPLATTNPLPNAAADAAGGLPISDAGGLDLDAILVDTNALNDTKIPDTISLANINAEVDTSMTTYGLDHLLSASVAGTDVTDNSVVAKLVSASATADWDDFVNTTDSLQAIRDRGDAAWTTGAGTGLTALASGTAQGGTASTIQLASGETFADDEMNGNVVKITSGTGAGQARVITDYTGATDTATISPNWTTNPSSDSVYEVVEGSMNLAAVSLTAQTAGDLASLITTVDTVVDGIQTDLDNGTDGLGAIKTDTAAILVDTAEIGSAGAGLSAIPWNANWDAEVESEVVDALETRQILRRATAQAGAAGSITLDASASATNSLYNGLQVAIVSGTGAGQSRIVTGYTGATKVATVAPNWTTNPSSDSVFILLPGHVNLAAWRLSQPNTLVSSRVDASVGAVAANAITATGIASNAITAAKIATDAITADKIAADAIGASELATDAANEIRDAILDDATRFSGADIAAILTEVDTEVAAIKAKTDNLPGTFQKNTAFNNFTFIMVLTTDHVTGATGLSVTAERSIDGAAFGACANSVSEIANGAYKINLAAADLNGDAILLRFSAATADDSFFNIRTEP